MALPLHLLVVLRNGPARDLGTQQTRRPNRGAVVSAGPLLLAGPDDAGFVGEHDSLDAVA